MTIRAALLALCLGQACAAEAQVPRGHWVDAVATGYSPQDDLDAAYRETKGDDLYLTAGRVSDVRDTPYGVAAPNHGDLGLPLRTRVWVDAPGWPMSRRWSMVDDTGSIVRRQTRRTGVLHIDLRFRTQAEARAFGRHEVRVFVAD